MEDSNDVGPGEDDPQLEGELVGVGAVWQLALADGGAGFGGEQVAPLLLDAGYFVVNTACLRAYLGGCRDEEAPAGEYPPLDVGQVAFAQREQALPGSPVGRLGLFEPYARPANEVTFDRLGVGEDTRLLDIACGSGLAAWCGAAVTGIDASGALVTIARARTAGGDFRVGDMFALPFPDACFDRATSFNGIWKGCEAALREAARVLVPGGLLGLTFWGRPEHLGLMPYFLKAIELSPPSHGEATIRQGDTGRPGVIEEMLASAGFTPRARGTVTVAEGHQLILPRAGANNL